MVSIENQFFVNNHGFDTYRHDDLETLSGRSAPVMHAALAILAQSVTSHDAVDPRA